MNEFRKRVLGPALLPLGAFAFIGVVVFSFSRILLAVPKDGSVIVGILMAGCILFAAGALSRGGSLKAAQRAALLGFGLLLVGGGAAAAASLGVRPVEEHLKADVKIATASQGTNFRFDVSELDVPAGNTFGLQFDNKDAGTSHNVHLLRAPGGASLFQGAIFAGPSVHLYPVPAIPAGVYYFQCDVHPNLMHGVVRAGGAKGPAAAAASPPAPPPAQPSPSAIPSGAGTTIALTVQNISFDKTTLTLLAGRPVTITFNNKDASIQHNFALYSDPTLKTNYFRGDLVLGPATKEYRFVAPGPGNYYFECEVHPQQMHGTVIIR